MILMCIFTYTDLITEDLRLQDFFSKLKNDYPDEDEIERTKEIIKL